MANELTEHQQNLVSLVNSHELGDIIKPLIREIHLFDSYIAGTTHLDDKSVLERIKVGDALSLQREDNKFDSNAILILDEEGKKLGYVPEKDNIIFARLMDAGKLIFGRVEEKDKADDLIIISLKVFMKDV